MRILLMSGASLAVLAATALALVEWQIARAQRRASADAAAAWFSLAIGVQWTVMGFWTAWALVCFGPLLRDVFHHAFGPDFATGAMLGLYVVPALAISARAHWRLVEAGRAIRSADADPGRALRRLLRPLIAALMAVLVLGLGIPLIKSGFPPIPLLLCGVLLAAAGVVLTRTPDEDHMPNAVTAGEMRDRIVALAAGARIEVRQFYVMPQTRERHANAFAANNGSVLITDYLLAHLGRDEVDAVMAHELAHLRRHDPQRMAFALFGVAIVAVAAWMASNSASFTIAAFSVGMLGFLAICRRLEYGADAGALALGARADALVSGLARLARLNHIPPRWSRTLEWTLTHPSLERRVAALVRRGALTAEQARRGLEDRSEPLDRYGIPAPLADGAKVFSTALKTRILTQAGWLLLAISVFAPAFAVLLAWGMGVPLPAIAEIAIATAVGSTLAAASVLGRFPHRKVRSRLADRLRARGLGAHVEGATLAGLSPGSDTRVIEGFYVWDAGFLKLSPGHLDYAGEETSFSLPAGRVQKLELVGGPPAWWRTRCVRVTWINAQGAWCTMRLFALEPGQGAARGRAQEVLFERLDAWRRAGEAGSSTARLSFEAPRHHEVTSIAPRDQVRPLAVAAATVLQIGLAALACGLLGLPLPPQPGPGFLEILLAAVLANVMLLIPSLRHREPATVERRSEAPGEAA